MSYPRIASLKTAEMFAAHLESIGVSLGFDETLQPAPESPFGQPLTVHGRTIGNRWCILPMEGWDGTRDGHPSDLTRRRWQRFGQSGAKLIWGGEAAAVQFDGRANPNQLIISREHLAGLRDLRQTLIDAHAERFGRTDDLYIGLQLTHSGRFCRPRDKKQLEPRTAYRHPILDRKFHVPPDAVMSDGEIDDLIAAFIEAGKLAREIGFDFVDVKHCHGYFGHELLSAVDRPGRFGGSLENRSRFAREVITGIRREAPGLEIGVRLSLFDQPPFKKGAEQIGELEAIDRPYRFAFGGEPSNPTEMNLAEPIAFLKLLESLGVKLICLTAGSPYYNPHIQRPALFPPSDGYQPPEDPLVGVARQIRSAREIKAALPGMHFVGSGYSYLQERLPHVGQFQLREGAVDFIGIGRMVLSYPELPADVLAGRALQHKKICRTFSDCTTGPRNGLVSGCFPLDPLYKAHADYQTLRVLKKP